MKRRIIVLALVLFLLGVLIWIAPSHLSEAQIHSQPQSSADVLTAALSNDSSPSSQVYMPLIMSRAGGGVIINEFMASNGATIADEDGDYEDWIELYNTSALTIALQGWGLSDDLDRPFRWVFPEVELGPGNYLLIWASGKNRAQPGKPLHTNFSISSAGEPLILTQPDNTTADQVDARPVPRDISYGRHPDGAGAWFYFDRPTPGTANITQGYVTFLAPPTFSHSGGFYAEDFNLTLSTIAPGVDIIYTLDGSLPDPDNLNGTTYRYKNQYPRNPGDPFGPFLTDRYQSHRYSTPITIRDRAGDPDRLTNKSSTFAQNPTYFPQSPVFKGTVVRARAVQQGALPSPVETHTFFVTPEGRDRYNLPIVSLSIQEDALFDYDQGIYVAGVDFDTWRAANPNTPVQGLVPANYHRRGDIAEFPTHIELFESSDSQATLSQAIGLRIHGGSSRATRVKSLRLYARGGYGDSEMAYPFFPDQPYDSYRRLILRNSGNDQPLTMFRDAAIQTIVAPLNFDTQAYCPTLVFINGEYWGLHNLRERYDRHYLARVYGVDPDNIDLLAYGVDLDNIDSLTFAISVVEGDAAHYDALLAYMDTHTMIAHEHYAYVKTQMDVDNFVDYQIAQIFARNTDWPHNNIDFWRLRTDGYKPDSPTGHDGRWRWLLFDTDLGFGLWGGSESYTHNTLELAATDPDRQGTFMLRTLLDNPDFRQQFITRFADLLNTVFLPERMVHIIQELQQPLVPEMEEHIARWSVPGSIDVWNNNVNVMTTFAERRPAYQRQHIQDYFGIPGTYRLTVNVSNPGRGYVRVNTIDLLESTPGVGAQPYPWHGLYFQGIPIELEAIPMPGYRFVAWEGLPATISAEAALLTEQSFSDDVTLTARFEAAPRETVPELIHYWLFDGRMPNDTPLETLAATYSVIAESAAQIEFESALEGYPFDSEHPNWRKASMERRNKPTEINYRPEGNDDIPYDADDMRGLQVKQPFTGDGGENTLIFHLPTTGYQDVVFQFAAMDEGAADTLIFDYAVNAGDAEWTTAGLSDTMALEGEFQLYTLDFTGIATADDNADFRIRVRFAGSDMAADDGGRVTFNNVSLDGKPMPALIHYWVFDDALANNTPFEILTATYSVIAESAAQIEFESALAGYPFDEDDPNWRKASMERRNRPTEINYQPRGNHRIPYEDAGMRGLQVKQPFTGDGGENAMIFHLPTTGYRDVVFRFAAMDEDTADTLRFDYAVNAGDAEWRAVGIPTTATLETDTYQLYTLDFSGINDAADNPDFRIRVRFAGPDMAADDGDRVTFNNISLEGNPLPAPVLLHYWLFDDSLPNNTPLETLTTTHSAIADAVAQLEFTSALEGYPFNKDDPNWRAASMERRNRPTEINYRPAGNGGITFENAEMRGLQVRQPFTASYEIPNEQTIIYALENTLLFHLPTLGYQDVVFQFAAMDEGAADALVFDYSVNSREWITDSITATMPLSDAFQLYTLDFTGIEAANDNPDFKIRIRFAGSDMAADDGNRVTFNNFTLDGYPLIFEVYLPLVVRHAP